MKCRIIAFDLDGTMLRDDKSMPEENIRALRSAAEAGIILVPATGRIVGNLPEALTSLPFIRYYIIMNGAQIIDIRTGEVLMREEMPLETSLKICSYAEELGCPFDAYADGKGIMAEDMLNRLPEIVTDPYILAMIRRTRELVPDLTEYLRKRGGGIQKMQMYFDSTTERDRQLELISELLPDVVTSYSMVYNLEINSSAAGKGNALMKLCNLLGIDVRASAAMGDNTNDLTMLEAAGTAVVMANGDARAKALADYVTEADNNHGSGAEAIYYLMNKE